jgi:hypothetical protein
VPPDGDGGSTTFLTSADRDPAGGTWVLLDAAVDGFALCSDGLAEGTLSVVAGPDGAFHPAAPESFGGYFAAFHDPAADPADLARRLGSPEFAATSGDDKSIVLAVRS